MGSYDFGSLRKYKHNCKKCGKPYESLDFLPSVCDSCRKEGEKEMKRIEKEVAREVKKYEKVNCKSCNGTGSIKGYKCVKCDGRGYFTVISDEYQEEVISRLRSEGWPGWVPTDEDE